MDNLVASLAIMPELPEVETIVRYLRPQIIGRKISEIWSNTPRLFREGSFLSVKKAVLGSKITGVDRTGKNIVLKLSNKEELWVHLMMSGKLLILNSPSGKHSVFDSYIRFWLKLDGGKHLALHDIRKFGQVRLLSNQIAKLGKDALKISKDEFTDVLKNRKIKIKPLLLNQKLISGIGNIYTDEILWEAGVDPLRGADTLKNLEINRIYSATNKILNLAIKKEGTSFSDYRKPDDSEGGYYNIRKVYDRAGEKCQRDDALIKRVVVAQRSSHFCPKHQK